MRKIILWLSVLCWGGIAATTAAQDCPAPVLLALARAGAACQGIERGEACYGNGSVSTVARGEAIGLAATGDMADITGIQTLSTALVEDDISVARLDAPADLIDSDQRTITFLLFGEAQITDLEDPVQTVLVTSTGTLNIRAEPDGRGEIIEQLPVRESAVANGRDEEGNWLRVRIPGTESFGWVGRDVASLDGNPDALQIVETDTPLFRPFEVIELATRHSELLCPGSFGSGVLLQGPAEGGAHMNINGVETRIAGTVFIQTVDGVLNVVALDGNVEFTGADGEARFVPAGAQVVLGDEVSTPEPYTLAALDTLPINNLPARLSVPAPLAQAEIDTLVSARFAPPPTPVPTAVFTGPEPCVRVVRRDTVLRSGPAGFYEIVRDIDSATRLTPVLQASDADGGVWWQLRGGSWIALEDVTQTGFCEQVARTNFIEAPSTNRVILETCETTNGPVREGQHVTFEFRPPAWETEGEARIAPQVDPGTISVGLTRLRVSASPIQQLTPDRYVRTFMAGWDASVGTFRVEGQRLSYIAVCDLTVVAGLWCIWADAWLRRPGHGRLADGVFDGLHHFEVLVGGATHRVEEDFIRPDLGSRVKVLDDLPQGTVEWEALCEWLWRDGHQVRTHVHLEVVGVTTGSGDYRLCALVHFLHRRDGKPGRRPSVGLQGGTLERRRRVCSQQNGHMRLLHRIDHDILGDAEELAVVGELAFHHSPLEDIEELIGALASRAGIGSGSLMLIGGPPAAQPQRHAPTREYIHRCNAARQHHRVIIANDQNTCTQANFLSRSSGHRKHREWVC